MSTVLLDTTVPSLLHPKKNDDVLRSKYESDMEGQILAVSLAASAAHYKLTLLTHDSDHVGLNFPELRVVYYS